MRKEVYNLEFRSYCPEMIIFGYRFTRADDYKEKIASLQHLLIKSYSEFKICANAGKNALTAYVELPERKKKSVLRCYGSDNTALSDILLLLSLFTGRDVFAVDDTQDGFSHRLTIADPRLYYWGNELRSSIPFKAHPIPDDEPNVCDIGFEEGLNQIYSLVRSEDWQSKYKGGYFLILANLALRQQPLETTFTQCWTIWEHLFSVHNDRWLSPKQIEQLNATEKIAFLLVEYGLWKEIDKTARERIKTLKDIRNRLVHFGRFPEHGPIYDGADLFIRWTEFIIAKALGLSPSNVLNTKEKSNNFLKV